MVRKKFKKLLQSIVTKYLILGIFTVSLLYPNLPAKKTSSDNNQLTFKTGLFSSQLTSSIAGIDTSLDVTSSGAKVSLSRHQSQITFATPLDDASMSHHQNKVSYQVPNKNIEVRYQLLPNGLKEDIILNKIPRETVFKTNLSLKNLKVDTSGKTPVFYDLQGNYQFHIQAPYAIDNQGKVTYDLKYHLVNQKDNPQEYILALEIDPSWLHDPSRVLPITIDPTVVHDTVSEFSGGQFNRIAQIGTGETAPELTTYYQENNSDLHTVGLWHLNEVSGDTVLDSSGNNNQGLATGTTIVDGLLGKSRNFNGTSGTISIGNTATLDFERTDSFSIEAWINTSTTNQGVIFSKRQSSAPLTGYELRRETNGIISFIIANTSTSNMLMVQTTNSVPTTGWHHVAATYNGSSSPNGIAIYINGLPQATTTSYNSLSASTKTSISAMIGSRNSTTFFDGRIDEVRVSNIVRSPEEIKMSASRRPYGVYTSPIIDYNNSVFSWNSFSWTELGVATGDGETLYDSTDLVAKWDFNTVSSSISNSGGTCGASCSNGSLIRFNNVTGIDTPPSAVGGTLSIAGGYNTHTFLGGYTTLATTHNIGAVELLIVAGGGGGANTGSGGGAGGYQYRTAYTGFQYGAGSYGISVGAGGIGGTATSASGTNGGTSQITEPGSGIMFQVIGGGGGVSHGGAAGQNGSSGSGGPIRTSAPAALGGRNSGGIGNSGGTGLVDAGWVGNSGGGGGAGAQGANGGNTAGSGNGGIGRTNSITGTNTYYAGGGGGGEVNGSYAGAGGAGGGGSAVVDGVGGSGTPNTGGGGAGGSYNGTYFNGGNGGSGITIIKYPNTSSGWTANRRWGSLAMEFDGVNDSITIPAHSSLNFSQTSPFSIETWVKLDSLKDQVIINKQRNTTNEFIYALRIGSSGKAVFEVAKQNVSSTTVTSTKALETDKWHFIVGTSDGTSINLYVDGVLQGTATIGFTSATQSLADLYIGQLYDESQFLSGFLDSTRIYSRTLGAREILANYNPGNIEFQTRVGNSSDPNDGTWDDWSPITNETSLHTLDTTPDFSPVSYWSLNESIGTSISDLRSGNHGYTINATISSGKFDVGRSLAGTGYVYVPHHTSLGFTGNFTISAWVNPSTGGNRQIISKTGAGGTGGFALLVGNMGEVFCRTDNGSTWVDSSTAWGDLPSSTGWHHVVAVRNGTSCRIYIDGIDETNSPGTHTSMVGNTFPLVVGARSDLSTEYWNGGIDEIRIYDKALSATQITTLYNTIPTRLHSSGFTTDTSIKAEGAGSMMFSTDPPKVDVQTIGLWHLDETGNSGAYIKDSSVNGNHGTPVGTSWTKGVFNGARYFNGSTDEINLGNIGIADSKANITVEAWIYSTTSDANHHRVFTENNVVYVGQYGTQAAFYMGNGTGWDNYSYTMGNIPLNQWVHVAWVKSGTTGYVYINGQLTGSMIAPATLGTSSNTNYISGQGSIQRWGGSIDEVKISNVARSSQEIAESYRLARNQYLNLPINNTDLSGKNSLPFYIAADRPGSYLSTIIGESDYANYQPDSNTVGLWHLDDKADAVDSSATGGTITTSGNYTIHTFTTNGTLTVNGPLSVEYLIVGGGGGGGFSQNNIGAAGGGGGAGGFRTGTSSIGTSSFSIVVGGGGAGSTDANTPGGTGGASSFNSIVSNGGGGGGVRNTSATTGGSGGGGASKTMTTGAAGTAGQGNSGANGDGSTLAGGGGGSSSAGSGRAGGAGTSSSISGSAVTYGVGGSGGRYLDDGPTTAAVAGTANRGNGGGAGTSMYENSINGAAGGSGIVIIRYLTDNVSPQTNDDSTNNNHGTLTGTTSVEGKIGKSRYFDGASTINIPNSSTLNIGNTGSKITIDFWMYPTSLSPTWQTLFYKNDGGTNCNLTNCSDRQYVMFLNNAGYIHFASTSANNVGISQTTLNSPPGIITTNQWYHVAGVIDSTNQTMSIYVDGVKVGQTSYSNSGIRTANGNLYLGSTTGNADYFYGKIDEFRVSNTARTDNEIAQSHLIKSRTHQVTIDFAAKLVSSNTIYDSTDDTFLIDATAYGLNSNGSSLYLGDKIIIQENVNGTQYTAQGTVNSVNTTSGLVSVSSWDSSSSFPAGGYTQNANVFKWQREYLPLNGITSTHRDSVNDFTIFINNGHEGRNIWIDDLRSAGSYLTNNIGSTITSAIGKRYFQYRSIFTSHDYDISSSITQVSSNYTTNFPPDTPTLISPSNASANQSLTPTFRTVTTDTDSDHLQYELKICTNQNMTDSCITLDQTSSNVGWSGMNVGTSAFSSGTTAAHILQTGTSLAYNTTYYWRTRAIDPSGSNTWSDAQTTPFYFSTDTTPNSPSVCTIDQTSYPGSYLIKWLDTSTDESGFEVYRIKNGANTLLTTTVSNATSHTDNDIQPGNTYAYKIRSVKTATGGTTAYSGYCDTTQLNPDIGSTLLQGLRLEGLQLN